MIVPSDDLNLTPEQNEALMASIARGEAQFKAGKGIPGAKVTAWLRSWGTNNELPPPSADIRNKK